MSGRRTSGIGARKLVIKPLKTKPKVHANLEEETWQKVARAMRATFAEESVSFSREELYGAVQDICIQNRAASLYARIRDECAAEVCRKASIRNVVLYLDQTYARTTQGVLPLWDLALAQFRAEWLAASDLPVRLVDGMLNVIQRERDGEAVERGLLYSLSRMMSALRLYHEQFEPRLLEATEEYYHRESERYLQQTEVHDYLAHCEDRLKAEADRCGAYLDSSTQRVLLEKVENQLLKYHCDSILTKGFDPLAEASRLSDLHRTYRLLKRVDCLNQLMASFNAYIRRVGSALVNDVEKDATMVEELLALKDKADTILNEAFEKDETFSKTIREAFETFINSRQNKPAELIAKFVDARLRAGNKAQSEDELEAVLDKIMVLFRFINGKDVFEAFYKKDLAKRLLLSKSASFDAEKSMMSKLKTECGAAFTTKLEGMFKDIELSKEIGAAFRDWIPEEQQRGASLLSVNVLTMSFWPPYQPTEIKLPKQIVDAQDAFKDFYLKRYSGRRLLWINTLGHCVLRGRFEKCVLREGDKEFSVSVFQAVVLLQFNNADKLTYREIAERTGIEEQELKRTLLSLSVAKIRVLRKHPHSREVGVEDEFSFNNSFTNRLYRIKINNIQLKESKEEKNSTHQRVQQDRQVQIDAAVVRIMKTRRTLQHNQLVAELYKQLKFPMTPQDIKKRIESLIERDYLERAEDSPGTYNYLA